MNSSSSFSRIFFPATLIVGLVGFCVTLYALWQAFVVLEPLMPSGAFAIAQRPDTPQGNPMKLYDSYRIFFVHLPAALSTATVSVLMAMAGVLYLISKKSHWDALMVASVQVGVVSCFITMATGYFWAEYAWGVGWTWEPRLTSTLILWLSFVALLMLRKAVDNTEKRQLFSAVYGIATVPLYPLVSRSIELFGAQAHPESLKSLLDANEITDLLSLAKPGLILLFVFFVMLRYWQLRIQMRTRLAMREITTP